MATVYSHEDTAANTIGRVRASRSGLESSRAEKALPEGSNVVEKRGVYTVVAADVTAGHADIDTGLAQIDSFQVLVYNDSNVLLSRDEVVTDQGGGVIRVADGASTTNLAADWTIQWSVRGRLN